MTTEYHPGIPSHAHIEAATRLGLLWQQERAERRRWVFEMREGEIWCDFSSPNWPFDALTPLSSELAMTATEANRSSYRPIRPNGTPVDWEMLDAEVARVAGAADAAQPQGFRADLWRRIRQHFLGDFDYVPDVQLSDVETIDDRGCLFKADAANRARHHWLWTPNPTRADILTRWIVYRELKPLYDLVDGATGEAAMPVDVEAEWHRVTGAHNAHTGWVLRRQAGTLSAWLDGRECNRNLGIGATWASRSGSYAVLD
ncbi:MAG: hypothetical protein VW405_19290, partial [Rhodospirillaceae bacterium]